MANSAQPPAGADFDELWARDFPCPIVLDVPLGAGIDEAEPHSVWIEEDRLLEVRTPEGAVRFTSWDDGLDILLRCDGAWRRSDVDPQLAFVGAARRMRADSAAGRFAMAVPEAVARAAGAAGTFELTALRLLRRRPEAWDLAGSAPNLFWLLCAHVAAARGHDAESLLRARRADLLSACVGAVTTRAAVRFVEKVVPELQSEAEARALARAAADPAVVHALRHIARVPIRVVELALANRIFLDADVFVATLARVAADEQSPAVKEFLLLVDDLGALASDLGLGDGAIERELRRARTLPSLRALRDRWVEELNARQEEQALAEYEGMEFPPSPLENTDDIIALRTPLDLLKEGRAMHHCLATHVKACLAGAEYVYRVLRPERATLAIEARGGAAFVRELKGPCNAHVSTETLAAVKSWIASHREARQGDSWPST